MKHSTSIIKLTAALVKAQAEIKHSVKDGKNPHFRTEYSTLASVIDACKSALNKNGIAVIQSPMHCESGILLETALVHESGEWVSSELYIPVSGNAQQYGSAMTYARRYSLASMAMVAPDDDDANEAATVYKKPAIIEKQKTMSAGWTMNEKKAKITAMPDEVKECIRNNPKTFQNIGDVVKFYDAHDWEPAKILASFQGEKDAF
jgi:hypothetical protein